MNTIIIFITIAAAIAVAALPWLKKFRHVFCVPEGWAGLVYHHGVYVRRSNTGRHIIWGSGWTITLIDLRKTSLAMSSEVLLLVDGVCMKIGVQTSYQITDPVRAAHETQHWPHELYNIISRALHAELSSLQYEELLNQRLKINSQLSAHAQPEASKIGINISAINLRFSIRPTEFGRPFTTAQNGGSTLVLGVPGGFVPLKQQTKNVAPEGHETK
jgi:regulator of protease activity HflC (stomatin/prohibitin superfamily)